MNSKRKRGGIALDLWRDVNRAAYAQSRAMFDEQRRNLAAEVVAKLKAGNPEISVREWLRAIELGMPLNSTRDTRTRGNGDGQ